MAKIIITHEKGASEVRAEGFVGDTCRSFTKPFLDQLGEVVRDTPVVDLTIEQVQTQTQELSH
jgi:hypothetical protein